MPAMCEPDHGETITSLVQVSSKFVGLGLKLELLSRCKQTSVGS